MVAIFPKIKHNPLSHGVNKILENIVGGDLDIVYKAQDF